MSAGNFRKRQFQDAKDRAHDKDPSFPVDLPVHGLRHTTSMILQRSGVDPVMLAHTLGHSRKALLGATAVYTHVEAERENPIVAAIMEKSIKDAKKALARQKTKSAKSGRSRHRALESSSPPARPSSPGLRRRRCSLGRRRRPRRRRPPIAPRGPLLGRSPSRSRRVPGSGSLVPSEQGSQTEGTRR